MRCLYTPLLIIGISIQSVAQISFGAWYTNSFREMSSDKLIKQNMTAGLMVKKPIGLSWTFGTGLGYKSIDARVVDYINDSDFAPYFRAKYPSKTLPLNAYFNETSTYRYNFIYVPVGAEFAVLPGFRIRYMYHVNGLIKANDQVNEYLEYGDESALTLSGNHDFALLFLNPVTQGHLIVGVVTQPQLFSDSPLYNYQFTPAFYKKMGGALSFYVGINFEANARPRKKSIL